MRSRIENLRWVIIEHPGGAKTMPVLEYRGGDGIWKEVPTVVIKVDERGDVIKGEGDDQDQ